MELIIFIKKNRIQENFQFNETRKKAVKIINEIKKNRFQPIKLTRPKIK